MTLLITVYNIYHRPTHSRPLSSQTTQPHTLSLPIAVAPWDGQPALQALPPLDTMVPAVSSSIILSLGLMPGISLVSTHQHNGITWSTN